jgi:hypothetical protein
MAHSLVPPRELGDCSAAGRDNVGRLLQNRHDIARLRRRRRGQATEDQDRRDT